MPEAIGRVTVGDVYVNERAKRPFAYTVTVRTRQKDAVLTTVDIHEFHFRDQADSHRNATISQLQSARKRGRRP